MDRAEYFGRLEAPRSHYCRCGKVTIILLCCRNGWKRGPVANISLHGK